MLAATAEQLTDLWLPTWGSAKLDGIRCLLIESPRTGRRLACSRTLKPIANIFIRRSIQQSCLPLGVDGEITTGDNFQDTASGVMSVDGIPDFHYHIFDYFGAGVHLAPSKRLDALREVCPQLPSFCSIVTQTQLTTIEELSTFVTDHLALNYEGCMFKAANTSYKFGRASLLSQELVKYKPYVDSTGTVVGMTELMHNDNEATTSELGYTERSSAAFDQIPGNTLGALIVRDNKFEQQFKIGTGFSAGQRKAIWNQRDKFTGMKFDYKYQPFGIKDRPRGPVFLRWRYDL